MNEVFQLTELTHGSPSSTRFYDPWEVTYGPDDSLWITEAKNYRVYKMSPNGSTPRLILDISKGSTFFSSPSDQAFNLQFTLSNGGYVNGVNGSTVTGSAPQGGLAGLAIHPNFLSGSPYVFVSYIWKFVKQLTVANKTTTSTATTTTTGTPANGGVYYQNSLVRFTYDFTTGKLTSPVAVCDTLPGSSDHNSQRIIIAAVGGTYYLFYANGDMGAGQFGNSARVENALNLNSYEGKILRFNLDPDADAGSYDKWIPNNNPFNAVLGKQSAVWAFGFRNNQGFAYANINGTDYLYGQMHGPFSDDEINIIHGGGNYGHPLVVGFKKDGNYNSAAAGNPYTNWTGAYSGIVGGLPLIGNEEHNADSMNQYYTYYDPIFTYYPAAQGSTSSPSTSAVNTIQRMYYDFNHGNQSNTYWPSEAPSGLDIYTGTIIPGWKNSLLSSVMKGAPHSLSGATGAAGKLMRLKLNSNGDGLTVSPTNADSTLKSASAYTDDTVSYFSSQNRFRDFAVSPDGLSLFAIIDSSSITSGPTQTNPANSLCKGCLLKFTFLGYYDSSGRSTIPSTIDVTDGTVNTCNTGTTISINSTNNNLWVPITGADGNIMAEIYPNGNNLGTVTSSFYKNSGALRKQSGAEYLDRNITITPQNQPATAVKIRLYISAAEFNALSSDLSSGVTSISDLKILKNSDACGSSIHMSTTPITPSIAEAHGSNGYVLEGTISSFSSFYFGSLNITLPVNLLSFAGSLQKNVVVLNWKTSQEINIAGYTVERSTDGHLFQAIGSIEAKGGVTGNDYVFKDDDLTDQSSPVLYYRLKIISKSGASTYSQIVTISLQYLAGRVTIFPNPAFNNVKVTITSSSDDEVRWSLIDNFGRTLLQNTAQVKKGSNEFSIDISGLSSGLYYLSVSGPEIDQKVKLAVIRL